MTMLDIANRDQATIDGFGEEWAHFDQTALPAAEHRRLFDIYFHAFRWDLVGPYAVGFDMGCGSGRWAKLLAPRVGRLHCIDPSAKALAVARRNLVGQTNVSFHNHAVDEVILEPGSMDFGVSLGVLHHLPDTAAAIASCVKLLKPGAPMLLYLYYRFDNRPAWFRAVWKASDLVRRAICGMPTGLKIATTNLIAAGVYWPLSRAARLLEALGMTVESLPLAAYRRASFYTLKTDALDRFGTRIEHRFTRAEMAAMMRSAGLDDIVFNETAAFWCACGVKQPR